MTEMWIGGHMDLDPSEYTLLLRSNNDYRHDTVIKPELLKNASITLDMIAYVFEDRDSVVKMWRDLGLTVLQVANGNF
jgi:hypothetical protein